MKWKKKGGCYRSSNGVCELRIKKEGELYKLLIREKDGYWMEIHETDDLSYLKEIGWETSRISNIKEREEKQSLFLRRWRAFFLSSLNEDQRLLLEAYDYWVVLPEEEKTKQRKEIPDDFLNDMLAMEKLEEASWEDFIKGKKEC